MGNVKATVARTLEERAEHPPATLKEESGEEF